MAYKATLTFASRDKTDLDEFIQHICEFGLMGCGVHTLDGTPTEQYDDPELDDDEDDD
jgi:hypothetical protein